MTSITRRATARSGVPADPSATIRYGTFLTTVGRVFVAWSARGIVALHVLTSDEGTSSLARLRARYPGAQLVEDPAAVRPVAERLSAYLDGDVKAVRELALDVTGTRFQRRVWEALRAIPWGTTATYGDVARAIGLPSAARAVGAACGANPIAILIPCHRVVAAGGLGGFGGGLELKRALLECEGYGREP